MRFQKADPVWLENQEKTLNSICAFCVRFGKIEKAELHITASNCYKAYLNGKFLGFGPSRAAHGYFRVDCIPLRELEEENVLFIEAAGYNTMNYWVLDQPAFLQAEITERGEAKYWTGKDFYVRRYSERLQKVSRFSYQRAFTESYIFEESPERTYKCCFGEKAQKPVRVKSGQLLPRVTDYPDYTCTEAKKIETGIFRSKEGELYRNICMEIEALRIYPIGEWESNPSDDVCNLEYEKRPQRGELCEGEYAVYDFEKAETGFIGIELEAQTDAHLYILFDEMDLRKAPDAPAEVLPYRNACVNIIEYRLKSGEYRHFTFEPYTARFVKILIRGGKIGALKVMVQRYENPDTGRFMFECADERLNVIMDAACRTFRHNAVDLLTDCPSRERAGWLCDSYFSAKAEQLFTGENKVEAAFLQNYAMSPHLAYIPEKMIPMCYPADFANAQYIPNWAMWYVVELYDQYLRSGDFSVAQASREKVYGVLSFFEKYRNEYDLLEDLESWVFVEWSKANDEEFIKGINFPSNMLYAKALESAGRLYADEELLKKSERVRQAVREYSFNGEFFEDNRVRCEGGTKLLGHITETCQYYAFFTEVATPQTYPKLFRLLTEKFGALRDVSATYPQVYKSNAFIGNYLRLMMLAKSDRRTQLRQECVDFFYNMAKKTGTLWENDNPCGSLDHGFASYAANLLVGYVSGFAGVHGNKILFMDAAEKIDCRIRIPVGKDELVFERTNGIEKVLIPRGYERADVQHAI